MAHLDPYFSLFSLGGAFVCTKIMPAVRTMTSPSPCFFLNDKEPFSNPSSHTGPRTDPSGPLSGPPAPGAPEAQQHPQHTRQQAHHHRLPARGKAEAVAHLAT